MNPKKFFEVCKEKGIEQTQIQISESSKFSVKVYHREVDSYNVADSCSVAACGIYKGRMGFGSTQKFDKNAFEYLANQIIQSATLVEKDGVAELFKGSEKYHKKNIFNSELGNVPANKKIEVCKEIEDKLRAYDKRIVEVAEVDYQEIQESREFYNSLGLKLKQKTNYYYFVAEAVGKQGEETKEGFDIFLDNDFSKFNIDEFVSKIGKEVISKFGGQPCESGKYPVILKNDVFASLLNYFLSSASSEEVQKKSSLLIGKLGEKIASSKLTIEEKPLAKNVFFTYFDDEGVATQNKVIVKKGVLQTYFYNRETAAKEGKESTGNGILLGGKIGVGFGNIFVKGGKSPLNQMASTITKGVYITSVAGLGTGMNEISGDFSCQAEGFMIEDGKITKPLNLITLSGNLLKMLGDIKALDNNVETQLDSITCPDVLIKKMSVGGK